MSRRSNSPAPLPSPPPSDDGSYGSDDSDGSVQPPYTPQELGAMFLAFYKFLTTLHYDEASLKIPPLTGWPQITRTSPKFAHFKSDYTLEVLRHLPYFNQKPPAQFYPASELLDFTEISRETLKFYHAYDRDSEFWSTEDKVDERDVVGFSRARENGSLFYLLVKDCEIIEDLVEGSGAQSSIPVEEFFENLKEQYQTLKLIPSPGRETIYAERVPEIERRIMEEEVHAQTEDWGTYLDIQYIRQIYRDHGWPNSFRLEEASKVIDDWQEEVEKGPRRSMWWSEWFRDT
ncbi:hypothetical protein BKA59DRAFT_485197 [Fusarium tricinctum]|uniref:Uncharacterized protein n=1 Tax=Fusarium tricinctum TaxID=61284 RepID=A0A8K0W6J6_9HYPO|nr:hypothetical protein BKA59DRAFT_485197 [Fusarium tricinctum]